MRRDYFRGYKLFKIIQLIILIIFAITFFLYIFLDNTLRNSIYTNRNLLTICVFLWAFMIYSVVSIILDFYQLEGHIAHDMVLNKAVFTDTLTGIPNRLGCDKIFEEYSNGKDISEIGCALVEISNLDSVNHEKGRIIGNIILVNFSRIIERVGAHFGFVGRNNGNGFLVIIENCDKAKMNDFITQLQEEVNEYNKVDDSEKVEFKVIPVLNESLGINDFTELIVKLYSIARG